MEIRGFALRPFYSDLAERVLYILKNDEKLHAAGCNVPPVLHDPKLFYQATWNHSMKNNADYYIITSWEKPIGMVSLAYKDFENHTARVGYWISSEYWNEGYGTCAFQRLIYLAELEDIHTISGIIEKSNKASMRIWEKYGASFKKHPEREGYVTATIKLKPAWIHKVKLVWGRYIIKQLRRI